MNAQDDFTIVDVLEKLKKAKWTAPEGGTVCLILSILCPCSLFLAFATSLCYGIAHHFWVQSVGGRFVARFAEAPDHIGFLALLAVILCFGGFLITVTTFVLGVMRSDKLAIVLSATTFVVSFPLLLVALMIR